jgi:uncharacterized membrane protein SpoIIM required for sporulation
MAPNVGGLLRRERFSVHFTNAAMVATLAIAHVTIGVPVLLLTQLPTLLLAGAAGVSSCRRCGSG